MSDSWIWSGGQSWEKRDGMKYFSCPELAFFNSTSTKLLSFSWKVADFKWFRKSYIEFLPLLILYKPSTNPLQNLYKNPLIACSSLQTEHADWHAGLLLNMLVCHAGLLLNMLSCPKGIHIHPQSVHYSPPSSASIPTVGTPSPLRAETTFPPWERHLTFRLMLSLHNDNI